MNSDQDKTEQSSNNELPPIESVAMDALLRESVGGKFPPDLKDSILQQYRQSPSADDAIRVSVTPVSRSQRYREKRRKAYRNWAIVSGLAVAASLAALIWTRPSSDEDEGIALARSKSVAKSNDTSKIEPSSSNSGPKQKTLARDEPSTSKTPTEQKTTPKKSTKSAIVLSGPSEQGQRSDQNKQEKQERRLRTPPTDVRLVSKTIDKNFRNYWKSSGVVPTEKASASDTAKRLSVSLGVAVTPHVLDRYDTIVDWLSDEKVGRAIARTWWGQVTNENFASLSSKAQKRLRAGFAKQLQAPHHFDQYLVGLIGRTDRASNDFYDAMVPENGEATHPDMVANLASLTMNVNVSCTRCHDSMVGGNYGQQEYWGFAATIDRGLQNTDGKLVRVVDKPAKAIFFETMDRRGRVAQPEIPKRWLEPGSSNLSSDHQIDSISDWAISLMGSPALASGVVNSLWKLVHGRPLSGLASHPMNAPMSDELLMVQKDLVDDLVSSEFDIRRTLALILMSPTTRRSELDSPRDVWATDQSDAHQKAIAFAGTLPADQPISMSGKVEQAMRAIGSVMPTRDRKLLAQIGESDKPARKTKPTRPLAWDFPDHADAPPVQWLQSVGRADAKIAHLCYLAGLDDIPDPILDAVDAMRLADVDEPTLLHRVWWMAQGQ